jgi:alpha-tubulin suppressor-like RCC1 family protein
MAGAVSVTAGNSHSCTAKGDGSASCWGANNKGQLGDGTMTGTTKPVLVLGLNGATQISAGAEHTCAVVSGGAVWCWGKNASGQLGNGGNLDSTTPVQVSNMLNASQIASRGEGTCARKSDGTLWCWGWGAGQTPTQVASLGNAVTRVAAGGQNVCAIKSDATLWCWGSNNYGQLGDGTTTDKVSPVQVVAIGNTVTAVAVGTNHTCAVKANGTVWCWGANWYGEIGDGSTTQRLTPVQVPGMGTTGADVLVGGAHSCAMNTSNQPFCWGYNFYGQLGEGTTTDRHTPTQNSIGAVARAAAGGSSAHNCAFKTDGSVWCWGMNSAGQLGDGTVSNKSVAVKAQLCQ